MIFKPTPLQGLILLEPERFSDNRGFFARTFCKKEFEQHHLEFSFEQDSLSFNAKKGTLRGLHFQKIPHQEIKLVSCVKGTIFDVAVDIRESSPTFGNWFGIELSAQNGKQLYIPKGFAHGFITLEENCLISYKIAGNYIPEAAKGYAWNDPFFAINWPLQPTIISDKDQQYQFIKRKKNEPHQTI